jgi:hypothetical protein
LPVIWAHEILRYSQVIPEGPELRAVFNKLSRMQRHSVDVGDVFGEAQASVLLGRVYLLDQQPHLAVEEFLRAIELNRLLADGSVGGEASFGLSHCEDLVPGQAN